MPTLTFSLSLRFFFFFRFVATVYSLECETNGIYINYLPLDIMTNALGILSAHNMNIPFLTYKIYS